MVVLLAVLADLALGDPPNRWHPTAWMGSAIVWAGRLRPRARGPVTDLVAGSVLAVGGTLAAAGAGMAVERLAARLPRPVGTLTVAAALGTTISIRGLDRAAAAVEGSLTAGDLAAARRLLAWHLVSRDTTALSASQVAAATIESVAENASDGVVAPLAWYVAGGLPAALAYRFANTADAMLGYRDPDHEWYGKAAARLDDALNLVPARLTALLLVLAAPIAGGSPAAAWSIMRRDGRRTASPNAGLPMSAMAGALSVSLEKAGCYRLGGGLPDPGPADLRRARNVARTALALGAMAAATLAGGRNR